MLTCFNTCETLLTKSEVVASINTCDCILSFKELVDFLDVMGVDYCVIDTFGFLNNTYCFCVDAGFRSSLAGLRRNGWHSFGTSPSTVALSWATLCPTDRNPLTLEKARDVYANTL